MASSKEYLYFILGQLDALEDIRYRYMMGEYVLYYKDKIFGGIYDDRFLIKNIPAASSYLTNITYELPYPNGKEMLFVDEVDDKDYLKRLIEGMYDTLPALKARKRGK